MEQSKSRPEDLFWFAARLFVGLLFAYAGFMKLIEPRGNFEAVLAGYPILPESAYSLISFVVPWLEWILGMLLIIGYAPRLSACVISLLLIGFLVLIGAGPLLKGDPSQDCGCFGKTGIKISVKTEFFVDLASLVLCVMLARQKRHPLSLDRWLRKAY